MNELAQKAIWDESEDVPQPESSVAEKATEDDGLFYPDAYEVICAFCQRDLTGTDAYAHIHGEHALILQNAPAHRWLTLERAYKYLVNIHGAQ